MSFRLGLGLGLGFSSGAAIKLQSLFNGFDTTGWTYTGSAQTSVDYLDAPVSVPENVPAIEGMRWTGTEWVDTDLAGDPIYPETNVRTRNGTVKDYGDTHLGYLSDGAASTVLSHPTTGWLRSQNCAIYGRVVPSAGGQDVVYALATQVDANNYLGIYIAPTTVRLRRVIGGSVIYGGIVNNTHAADAPFEYQAVWSDQGMAIRVKPDSTGVWSDWDTNPASDPAPIASTFEIGSKDGAMHFNGNYPMLRTAFLPSLGSLGEYQTYVEDSDNNVWQVVA